MRRRFDILFDFAVRHRSDIALVLAALSCLLSVVLYKQIVDEAAQRRDQSCRGLELGHLREIRDLRQSYSFYADPPPGLKDLLKDPRALRQLGEQAKDAMDDQDAFGVYVPPYCDKPGFGLPEPDPKVPLPPKGLLVP